MSLTTHPNIIDELIRYYIRFPNRDNILKRFRKRPSDSYKEAYYQGLIDYLNGLEDDEHSICNGLEDFCIAAADSEYIKKQIEDMDGRSYLMLDYGAIDSARDTERKFKIESPTIAITVAKQYKPDQLDQFEHAALSDEMLNHIRCIRQFLIDDDASCSGTKDEIGYPHQIIPFFARDLQNSIGWTLSFNRRIIDLL